jgi:hypothetical protein
VLALLFLRLASQLPTTVAATECRCQSVPLEEVHTTSHLCKTDTLTQAGAVALTRMLYLWYPTKFLGGTRAFSPELKGAKRGIINETMTGPCITT